MFSTPTWLYRYRMWKYRRRRNIPHHLGGIWKGHGRFRNEAEQDINWTSEGWAPKTIDPGHYFVSKELAIRYESAAAEAQLHYMQICDLATPEEADERLRRITDCLDTMHQLSIIEQQVRPALSDDITNQILSKD